MKKTKNIMIGIVAILLLAFASIFFINYEPVQEAVVPDCVGGTLINSISNVFVTNSQDLNGKQVIRVSLTGKPSGECAEIILDKNAVNQKLSQSGYGISQSVFLDLTSIEQSKMFNINSNGQGIFKSGYIDAGFNLFPTTSWCNQKLSEKGVGGTTYLVFAPKLSGVKCYYWYPYGDGMGEISFVGRLNSKVGFSAGALGSTVVDSRLGSAKIGDKIHIKWGGDLINGIDITRPNYDGFNIGGVWRLVKDGTYSNIENKRSLLLTCVVNVKKDAFLTQEKLETECLNPYNDYVNLNTVNLLPTLINVDPIISSATTDGISLNLLFNESVTFPSFTVDIDASFVGIFQLISEPDVSCPADQTYNSGESKEVNFIVKNKGSNNAVFALSLTCGESIKVLNPSAVSLLPNAQGTVKGIITGTNREDVTGEEKLRRSCIFVAIDPNSLKQDSCTFIENIVSVEICTPGKTSCSEDLQSVLICNSQGNGYTLQSNCDYGCEDIQRGAQCRTNAKEICTNNIDDDNDNLIDFKDPDCLGGGTCKGNTEFLNVLIVPDFGSRPRVGLEKITGFFNGTDTISCTSIFDYIKWAFSLIVFFVSLILITGILNLTLKKFGILENKNQDGYRILIGVIFGIILSFLIYTLVIKIFWFGIIIGIVLLILYLFLKNKLKMFF